LACREKFTTFLKILITIASLQTQFVVLDEALKITNRRVNALEYIMIPKILWVIDWINLELDEESREDFTRLKKVQDNKKKEKEKAAETKSKHLGKQMEDDNEDDKKSEEDKDLFQDTAEVESQSSDEEVFV
jgi:V-type H+-transporting ATPase subunit D